MKSKDNELKVFITSKETECAECGENLGHHGWITLNREKGALCLACGDLDHLAYLPAGDAALTRRSKKYSKLYAVVLKWSRNRKRYERQGLLVEEAAIEKAEEECLKDEDLRAARRERAAIRRAELDQEYVKEFAAAILKLYPKCPGKQATEIAEHACRKYSGRVGRSAAAKEFSPKAIELAVGAHIRHQETNYDELLLNGWDRYDAREKVRVKMLEVLDAWSD